MPWQLLLGNGCGLEDSREMRRRKLSFAQSKCSDLDKASTLTKREITLHRPIDANMDVHGCAWGLKKGFKREEGYPTIETCRATLFAILCSLKMQKNT